jgi:hypothetical protein
VSLDRLNRVYKEHHPRGKQRADSSPTKVGEEGEK